MAALVISADEEEGCGVEDLEGVEEEDAFE